MLMFPRDLLSQVLSDKTMDDGKLYGDSISAVFALNANRAPDDYSIWQIMSITFDIYCHFDTSDNPQFPFLTIINSAAFFVTPFGYWNSLFLVNTGLFIASKNSRGMSVKKVSLLPHIIGAMRDDGFSG